MSDILDELDRDWNELVSVQNVVKQARDILWERSDMTNEDIAQSLTVIHSLLGARIQAIGHLMDKEAERLGYEMTDDIGIYPDPVLWNCR
ncbi:MAG: hypothetical protein EXR45_08795 [Chloroflexi bacterium]|nr:hypothetical protein [Chloroflexota bacterium]